MVAGIVEAIAGQVERALKQQEEEKMIHAEIPRIYAELENEMVKKTEEKLKPTKANDRQVGETQHYKKLSIQPWDAMEEWLSPDEFRGYLIGNSLKYLARAGKKGSYREDIQKAHHYLEKLLEVL